MFLMVVGDWKKKALFFFDFCLLQAVFSVSPRGLGIFLVLLKLLGMWEFWVAPGLCRCFASSVFSQLFLSFLAPREDECYCTG